MQYCSKPRARIESSVNSEIAHNTRIVARACDAEFAGILVVSPLRDGCELLECIVPFLAINHLTCEELLTA